jgi:hypothetical protein
MEVVMTMKRIFQIEAGFKHGNTYFSSINFSVPRGSELLSIKRIGESKISLIFQTNLAENAYGNIVNIAIIETGESFDDSSYSYLDTFFSHDYHLSWHIFIKK